MQCQADNKKKHKRENNNENENIKERKDRKRYNVISHIKIHARITCEY